MTRLLYALAVGLVGAALVHVAIMLAWPGIAAGQAWRRLEAALPLETPRRAQGGALPVAPADPLFRLLLCRFDLRDGPLRLASNGRVPFWSAAVFASDGRALGSANSAMTGSEAPNLRVLSAARMTDADTDQAFPLVVEQTAALLVLRVFVPDESWTPSVDALLRGVTCRSEHMPQ